MDRTKASLKDIIHATHGQIDRILTSLGIPTYLISKDHIACPRCGVKKYRISSEITGAGGCDGICRDRNGGKTLGWKSVIGLVGHYFGIEANEATQRVAEIVGLDNGNCRGMGETKRNPLDTAEKQPHSPALEQSAAPAEQNAAPNEANELIRFDKDDPRLPKFFERWFPEFCSNIPPVQIAVRDLVGIEFAYRVYPNGSKAERFVVPIYRHEGNEFRIVNWACCAINGQKDQDGTRSKVLSGRGRNGLFLSKRSVQLLAKGEPAKETIVIRVEGFSDFLTMVSIAEQQDANFLVFSNSFGASDAKDAAWFRPLLEKLQPKELWLVGDNDPRGIEGVQKWANALQGVAPLKVVELPEELNDCRDYFNAGKTFDDFVLLASESVGVEDTSLDDNYDDPLVLARNNIKFFEEQFQGRLAYHRGHFYKYRTGVWIRLDRADIRRDLTESINRQFTEAHEQAVERWKKSDNKSEPPKKKRFSNAILANVETVLASLVSVRKEVEIPSWITPENHSDINKHRNYLAFSNGILDLNQYPADGFFSEQSSNWFSLSTLRFPYDAGADCPRWIKFVNEAMEGDQERISLLQEWFGYILTPDNRYQKLLLLEGKAGAGKTVVMAGIQSMLGKHNYSSLNLSFFGERFLLSNTLGKLCNFSPDEDKLQNMKEGLIKAYVGGDSLVFDVKNDAPITARPTAKLVISWNNRPYVRDRSQGFWRRLHIIPFDRPATNVIEGMDSPEYWEPERAGLVNWALFGLIRLRQQGWTKSRRSAEALESYQGECDPTAEFFQTWVEHKPGNAVRCSYLYERYRQWATDLGHSPLNARNFGGEVFRHFPNSGRERKGSRSERLYVYSGLRLRENFEIETEIENQMNEATGEVF
jgi:P4 family phage/plasmid primase-like protien